MSLVLTLTPGQTVMIGDDITVTVAQVKGAYVRVVFDAPVDIPVDRESVRLSKEKDGVLPKRYLR